MAYLDYCSNDERHDLLCILVRISRVYVYVWLYYVHLGVSASSSRIVGVFKVQYKFAKVCIFHFYSLLSFLQDNTHLFFIHLSEYASTAQYAQSS